MTRSAYARLAEGAQTRGHGTALVLLTTVTHTHPQRANIKPLPTTCRCLTTTRSPRHHLPGHRNPLRIPRTLRRRHHLPLHHLVEQSLKRSNLATRQRKSAHLLRLARVRHLHLRFPSSSIFFLSFFLYFSQDDGHRVFHALLARPFQHSHVLSSRVRRLRWAKLCNHIERHA